jgi:hypothetical protein
MSQNISTKSFDKQIFKVTNLPEKNMMAVLLESENEEKNTLNSSLMIVDKNYNEIESFELDSNESCHSYAELYLKLDESNEIVTI